MTQYINTINKYESHIWLQIDKKLTQTTSDVYFCAVHIPPPESPYYNEEIFDILHTQMNHFQAQGKVSVEI